MDCNNACSDSCETGCDASCDADGYSSCSGLGVTKTEDGRRKIGSVSVEGGIPLYVNDFSGS